jgi:hypothetical protein
VRAEPGARARERRRFPQMIQAEVVNLEKAQSVLYCLKLAMEYVDLTTTGVAYFPGVVQVAGDLVARSIGELEELSQSRVLASKCPVKGGAIG